MSQKERVVHKQQFQNAQQTVEILIKAKPKPKVGFRPKTKKPVQKPFVRDCMLKKELEKLVMQNQENFEVSEKTCEPNSKQETVNIVQISKKSHSRKKKHNILLPNTSWGEHLEQYRTRPTSTINSAIIPDSHSVFSNANSHCSSRPSTSYHGNKKENMEKASEIATMKKVSESTTMKTASERTKVQAFISQPDNARPLPLTELSQKNYIHKSIQTSFQTPLDSTSRNKSSIRPAQITINQAKSSVDQTQSPFGESALQLLQQLRERLRSRGDSEGSEIVSVIEAWFGSAGSKAGNRNTPGIESIVSPLFPSVFPTPHVPNSTSDQANEQLKRVILEQQKEIKEQAETIQDLNFLSAKLLALHEQLSLQKVEEENVSDEGKSRKLKAKDSGVELSSSNDAQKTIKNLTMEKETLLREVKGQRDIILKLELKLDLTSKELEALRRSNVALPGRSTNNGAHHNLNSRHQPPILQGPGRDAQGGQLVSRLLCHTPNDSDADSAFEEKSSKSSGIASANSNKNLGEHEIRYERNRPRVTGTDQPDSGTDQKERSLEMINEQPNPDSLDNTPRSHYKTLTKYSDGLAPFGFSGRLREDAVIRPTADISLTVLSDLSSDNNHSVSTALEELRLSHNYPVAGNETPLSETPVLAPSGYYLESTHVHKGQLSASPSKSRPLQRRLLHTEFSPLDATGERVELEPEVCSRNDESL